MRFAQLPLGLTVLLVLSLVLSATSRVVASHIPTRITPLPGTQEQPRTDGTTVVWREGSAIYAASIGDRTISPIAPRPARRFAPDIDNGIAIWAEEPQERTGQRNVDVWGKEIATGRDLPIAVTPAPEEFPAIAGRWVVWIQDRQLIRGRDIDAMADPVTIARTDDGWSVSPVPLRMSGNRVLWGEVHEDVSDGVGGAPERTGRWRVRVATIGDVPITVAEGAPVATLPLAGTYDIAGDLIFQITRPDQRTPTIQILNMATGEHTLIVTGAISLTTDGRFVFFRSVASDSLENFQGLKGYDLMTHSLFQVTTERLDFAPHTRGGVLVWQRGGLAENGDVHAATVADVLPSAFRPGGTTGADRSYFPDTGHSLAFGFKTFWERSGGLPVFGYPLTEEFEQRNADTGRMHTVQYLERQRFEYHPEHQGMPYETELGRLGAEDAVRRGMLSTWAFQPVPADADHPAGCVYVPDTSHRLCGEFRPFWQDHGLEFGDPGVSFREALALFGYPISEEFTDPETGLITQYFERAVFEYHPNNPPPYRVLLRRLGAERLTQAGW